MLHKLLTHSCPHLSLLVILIWFSNFVSLFLFYQLVHGLFHQFSAATDKYNLSFFMSRSVYVAAVGIFSFFHHWVICHFGHVPLLLYAFIYPWILLVSKILSIENGAKVRLGCKILLEFWCPLNVLLGVWLLKYMVALFCLLRTISYCCLLWLLPFKYHWHIKWSPFLHPHSSSYCS